MDSLQVQLLVYHSFRQRSSVKCHFLCFLYLCLYMAISYQITPANLSLSTEMRQNYRKDLSFSALSTDSNKTSQTQTVSQNPSQPTLYQSSQNPSHFLQTLSSHHQPRLLLQCMITDCVYCIKINSTQLCIVCSFPKYPNGALDQCQTPSNNQTESQTTCTIQSCRTCQFMALGIIQSQICTQCSPGYRFLILQGECFPIKELNDSNQIISYGDYYYLCQQGCKQCEPTTTIELCFTCRDGYSMIEGAYTCVKCFGECKECEAGQPEKCLGCFNGAVLFQDRCVKCAGEKCLRCSENDRMACLQCRNEYFVGDYGTCKQCPENCMKCKNSSVCLSCNRGHFLLGEGNSSSECVKCIAGCYECTSLTQCSKCYPGFYRNANQCLPCKPNCLGCTSSSDCTKCLPGYDRFNGACIKPLPDCILMNHDGKCKVCKSTFEVSPEGKCTASNGFDTNLVTIACKYGMFAQNYWCYSCPQTFPNCIECNSRYCLKCKDGYVLKDQDYTCEKCTISGCKVCQSQMNCLECESGYFMLEYLTETGLRISYGYCKACDENCKTCIGQNKNCLECKENYTLSIDRTCEGMHKLGFNITLNTNMQVFQKKAKQIKNAILESAKLTATNLEQIKLTKIYSGSVVMEGYLHFESQSGLSASSQSVTQVVKSGNSLMGIPIVAASFDGQLIVYPPSSSKLGTILAIAIPSGVGLILIIIIIVILYRRRNNEDQKKTDSTNGVIATDEQVNNPPEITAPGKPRNDLPTIIEEQSKVEVDAEIVDMGSEKGIQTAYQYL